MGELSLILEGSGPEELAADRLRETIRAVVREELAPLEKPIAALEKAIPQPAGGAVCRVRWTIAASSAGVRRLGRPERGRSLSRPARPLAS